MPRLARAAEQLAGAAADVEDGRGVPDEAQVEVVAGPPRIEDVIEARDLVVGVRLVGVQSVRNGRTTIERRGVVPRRS